MDALETKYKTEAVLVNEGISINKNLPKIEDISEFSFANVSNIRKRAVALSYVLAKAFGAPHDLLQNSINTNDLVAIFSPNELSLINEKNPTQECSQQFQLSVEALWELAWVLGLIPKVNHWDYCGNNLVNLTPKPGDDPSEFLSSNQMRAHESIYEEADFLFRLHWASREAYLTGQPEPTGVPEYVIDQRHKVINWVSFGEVSWDEVDTST